MSTLQENFFLENLWPLFLMLCNPSKLGLTPSIKAQQGAGVRYHIHQHLCIPRGRWMGLALVTEAGWQQLIPNFHTDVLRSCRREGQKLFAGRGSAFQSAACMSWGLDQLSKCIIFHLQLGRCSSTLQEFFTLNLALFSSVWNYL